MKKILKKSAAALAALTLTAALAGCGSRRFFCSNFYRHRRIHG